MKKTLKLILSFILFIMLISLLLWEYMFYSNKLIWFYWDNKIEKSNLFIDFENQKITLYYDEKEFKKLNEFSSGWLFYKADDHLVRAIHNYSKNDIRYLESELDEKLVMSLIYEKISNDSENVEKSKINEINKYSKIFWEPKILLKRSNNEKIYYWINKDTILYIYTFSSSSKLFWWNWIKDKYILRVALEDKRLSILDTDWTWYTYEPDFFYWSSMILPISRFGFFKKIWYL